MFLGHVACAECKDVALCYRYRLASPSVSVVVSPTKTSGPVKMPFLLWTRVGPRNRVLGGGVGRWENGNFGVVPTLKCIVIATIEYTVFIPTESAWPR